MASIIEVDFNNVTRERHLKARVPADVHVGDRVVAFDPAEEESLDGTVLTVTDGRAVIDVQQGRVAPRPLAVLQYRIAALKVFSANSISTAAPEHFSLAR